MVEPPGTAPGSDPLITCAFMSIVRANPDSRNIGAASPTRKRGERRSPLVPLRGPIHPLGYFRNGKARARQGLFFPFSKYPCGSAIGDAPCWRACASPGDQKPALIFSNSASCFSRCAGSFGVWARIGALIGDRPSFTAGSFSIVFMATVEVWP